MAALALLAFLANHPDIRPQVAPGLDYVDVRAHDVPGLQVFGDERGAVMFRPSDEPGIYEIHYLFTKAIRGKAALDFIRQCIALMFTEHSATVIGGAVPREHRASRVMSRALGFRPIGSHTDFFGRDSIVYSLERASWAVLSEASSAVLDR